MATTSQKFSAYHNAVAYLERLASAKHDQAYMHNRSDRPEQYVERTRELVEHLGNPLNRGVRVIHVAGTAGKGTTTTYLHNILHMAGYRVGSFMSPYATTSIEKIRVNDKLVDPNVFAQLVERVKPVIERMGNGYQYGRPSYFEIFFAIALLYFKKMRCDWIVLEVGCGGRYDAGMIFPKAIAAITNIGLDHTQLLGKTLPKIAKEKAGIIRKNSHVFTTERRPSILKLFKDICKQKNTKLHIIKEGQYSPNIHPGNTQPTYRRLARGALLNERGVLPRLNSSPLLNRAHAALTSTTNASLSAAIAKHLKIPDHIIHDAIAQTSLPCRFEIIQKNPLVILDGAHNPMKVKSVVHNLKGLTYATLYTMFGCSSAKDAQQMVRQLAKVTNEFIFTKPRGAGHTFYDPHALSRMTKLPKRVQPNPRSALPQALKKLKPQDALLITGSFYLAGELRKHWINERTVLTKRNHV